MFSRIFTKRTIGIIIIISLLLAWGLIRSCSQDKVQRKQLYTIARDNSWYPHDLMGKERNLLAFTDDLFAAIAKTAKLQFKWVKTSPSTLLGGLDEENYDAIISSMRPNIVNRNHYIFSEPFFELGPVLIVPQDSSISSLKEMQGKTVAIPSQLYFIFNNLNEIGPNGFNIHFITYDNMNQTLNLLENDRIDGIIMNSIPAYTLTEGFYANRLKVVTAPFTDEGLRLVALRNKDSEALFQDFEEALKALKTDGTYESLNVKWNLVDPKTEFLKHQQE